MTKPAIRSFVLRQGRMTPAQEKAFGEHWERFGVDFDPSRPLTSARLFGNDRPLVLEIGFGMGDSLLQMAAAAPAWNFLGVEVHRPGVGRLLNGIARAELSNLKVIRHDAVEVLTAIPAASLERIQVYFPDPWPKARHHKRRLLQTPLLQTLADKLRPGGELHCATDWENYAQWIAERLLALPELTNLGDATGFSPRPDFRPETKFERRGLGLGHGVWDLRFIRAPGRC